MNPSTAVQPQSRIIMHQLAAGVTYAVAMYLVIVAVQYARGAFYALPGQPLWFMLLVGLLFLCFITAQAYALSALIRHWSAVIAALAVPIGYFIVDNFVPTEGVWYSLMLLEGILGDRDLIVNTPFFIGRALITAGACLLVVVLIWCAARRARLAGGITMLCSVLSVTSGLWVVQHENNRAELPIDPDKELVAIQSDDKSLTLHMLPMYRPVADKLLKRWEFVQTVFAKTPAAFTELRQRYDHADEYETGEFDSLYLGPGGRDSNEIASLSVIQALDEMRSNACGGAFLIDLWLAGPGSERYSSLPPQSKERLKQLRTLDAEEGQAWMAKHYTDYIHCTLDDEELPKPQ